MGMTTTEAAIYRKCSEFALISCSATGDAAAELRQRSALRQRPSTMIALNAPGEYECLRTYVRTVHRTDHDAARGSMRRIASSARCGLEAHADVSSPAGLCVHRDGDRTRQAVCWLRCARLCDEPATKPFRRISK
jgi:hypothetical protein